MAYAYRQYIWNSATYSMAGYVDYDLYPETADGLGVGDTVTVSGQIRWTHAAIKCVIANLSSRGGWSRYDGDTVIPGYAAGYLDKAIAKSATGTFSISVPVTQEWIDSDATLTQGGTFLTHITFHVSSMTWANTINPENVPTEDDTYGDPYMPDYPDRVSEYSVIEVREDPVINSAALSDGFGAISGTDTPLDYFGGYVQGKSLPRITVSFDTDGRDLKLEADHEVTISGGTLLEPRTYTAHTAAGASSAAVDLPAPDYTGTITWVYTLTDSQGHQDTDTGAYTVYGYSVPSISGFEVTRYKTELDPSGSVDVESDDGEKVWITLGGSVQDIAQLNAWTLRLRYQEAGGSSWIDARTITGMASSSFAYVNDKTLVTATFAATTTFSMIAELTDIMGETVSRTVTILKAGGYMNIEKNGVAVGMRTTGDANEKKFEVAADYTSYFYGPVKFGGSGLLEMECLWRKASPTASMGGNATLTLSRELTAGEPVVLVYRMWEATDAFANIQTVIGWAGHAVRLVCVATGSTNRNGARPITIGPRGSYDASTVYFGNCEYNGSNNNNYCVLLAVFAFKQAPFNLDDALEEYETANNL